MRRLEKWIFKKGEFLAGWLNSDGWGYSAKSRQETEMVLWKLKGLLVRAQRREKIPLDEFEPVNALLAGYPEVPRVRISSKGRLSVHYLPAQGSTFLNSVLILASEGFIERLRKCEKCSAWFFASTDWQRFDSTKCRQSVHRSHPEFKEKNRKYQRNYYALFSSASTLRASVRSRGKTK